MNKKELTELLNEIAEKDTVIGADISDHPCAVAVRAIEQAFKDIETLKRVAVSKSGSKHVQTLVYEAYNPSW